MIEIVRSIAAPAARDEVFEFLAEPRNHWELCGGSIELLEISEDADRPLNGVVRIRGPLGLSRLARTWVTSFERPTELGGVAEIGSKTVAEVRCNPSEHRA